MADLGFDQISIEPVVSLPDEPYAIKEEDIPYLLDQYDILAKEMIKRHKEGRGFNFFHFMIDLTGGPCVAKRLSGCGSGTEYLSVTPWGDLYPCHQFVGEDGFCIGNVNVSVSDRVLSLTSVLFIVRGHLQRKAMRLLSSIITLKQFQPISILQISCILSH